MPDPSERIGALHRHSRGIGIALSATIVTFCSATIAWTLPKTVAAMGSAVGQSVYIGWALNAGYTGALIYAILKALWFQYYLYKGFLYQSRLLELHLKDRDTTQANQDQSAIFEKANRCGKRTLVGVTVGLVVLGVIALLMIMGGADI